MRRARGIAGTLFLTVLVLGVAERSLAEESLGNKIWKILAPTPTPTPRKHRKSSAAPKKKEDANKSPAPKPSATPEKSPSTFSSKKKKHKSPRSPTPTPGESPTPSTSPTTTPAASESSSSPALPPPFAKKKGAPATIAITDLSGFENYPPNVRKIMDTALDLTTQNLDYKYGSADPANGGMDCSGFVFYVLKQNGIGDVPRDSSQQYVWLRKAGTFKAVNSRHEDTFELDELVPGDLLFWTGTYSSERDPPITHAMIYLGREKGSGQRVMVGASDGRTYQGESRYGVSVFDFKIPGPPAKTDESRTSPSFIGYGHIPGL